jgi:hypothetical protein
VWVARLESTVLGLGNGEELKRRLEHVANHVHTRYDAIQLEWDAALYELGKEEEPGLGLGLGLGLEKERWALAFGMLALSYERGNHLIAGRKLSTSRSFRRLLCVAFVALHVSSNTDGKQGCDLWEYVDVFRPRELHADSL